MMKVTHDEEGKEEQRTGNKETILEKRERKSDEKQERERDREKGRKLQK